MGKTYAQLSIEERAMIQTQLSVGLKPSQIARELGRFSGAKLDQWASLLRAGAAKIAVNCLLSVCAACFAGNAAAGGMNSGLGAINGSVGAVLKKAGLGSDVPASVKHDARPVARTMKRAGANAGQTVAPVVSGLIVRFASPEARYYARENGSPPQALIDEMNALAGTPLTFFRPMAMDGFVFRFASSAGWEEAQAIVGRLKQSPSIARVELDIRASRALVPDDPYASLQWNLMSPTVIPGSANLYPAWDITTGSSESVVAVIDTGIRLNTEFADRVVAGYDFISDTATANDGDGRDADPIDPGDWNLADECGAGSMGADSSWHGTHVTGIIAAAGNNSTGMAGVNWKARILPVRVLGKCGGDLSDIIDGMLWAAGIDVPGVPANSNPAKVINMSLGGSSPGGCDGTSYVDAINQIKARGVLIVVAAGNDDTEAANFVPASCDGVLTVGAVGPDGYRASYSNYSEQYKVDISAPGGDMDYYGSEGGILSTVNSGKTAPAATGEIVPYQGTSMAAPHVAGIAALALARDSQVSPELLALSMLFGSRSFPDDSQCTQYYPLCGAGIVDAEMTLLVVEALKPYALVYEYYNTDLKHYFRTSGAGESQSVLTGGAGPGWIDTKDYFLAWRDDSQGAVPVCRFYGTPGKGPNSHFYTADAGECNQVKQDPGWTYEGIAYYIQLPVNGSCLADTIPIYRAYNNRWMYNDSNHRFTTDMSVIQGLVGEGWISEGVVMCAVGG